MRRMLLFAFSHLLAITICIAQTDSTYAERLGYPKGARVLILHVDDAGMSFDSNEGTILALTKGAANSCSVMMPCPWVPDFIAFLKQHPETDAGLHLTLNSEWKGYRWGPLSGKKNAPGLTDTQGAMWRSVEDVVKNATATEVDMEIRSQYERALQMGFTPTHFDSHMGTLFASPAYLAKYIQLGIEKNIPVMMPGGHNALIQKQMQMPAAQLQQLQQTGKLLWNAGLPVLDDLHNGTYDWKMPDTTSSKGKLQAYKTPAYINALKELRPGITMLIMHCTQPSPVFEHISDSGPSRKADLLAMMDPKFKEALAKQKIILTTWRELKKRRDAIAAK